MENVKLMTPVIFLHGYESSGEGFKATYLKTKFPDILTPTFTGDILERLQQLESLIDTKQQWVIIGSSYGGLQAILFAKKYPESVDRLILLAPALISPFLSDKEILDDFPVHLPTRVIHGIHDTVISLDDLLPVLQDMFTQLNLILVDDDHVLHQATPKLDWHAFIHANSNL
jgi:surfactin synthase thioesterase subunit